jgi:signal transduction histidine kinase
MRHSQATQISIRLHCRRGQAVLEVRDNGRGISREETKRSDSLGLLGMRERALAHGGQVTISGQPGQGTTISARIPLGIADQPSSSADPGPPAKRRASKKKPNR